MLAVVLAGRRGLGRLDAKFGYGWTADLRLARFPLPPAHHVARRPRGPPTIPGALDCPAPHAITLTRAENLAHSASPQHQC